MEQQRTQQNTLLSVRGLKTEIHTDSGVVHAVDGLDYEVRRGEIVSIVGESGCGKSVSQYSILQLMKMPPAHIAAGTAEFCGKDLLGYEQMNPELCAMRGSRISMIFQEPMTSLNPSLTVGKQIMESLRLHQKLSRSQAYKQAIESLREVGIPDPETRINYYPHQFSGGMCQRIMIAMAICCRPDLLIADEATTALDVTTQEQILELLQSIVRKHNTSVVMITHNLGIVARYAKRIYVMYAGHVVESGLCEQIFHAPHHPYTIGLLKAVPRLDIPKEAKLIPIDGTPMRLIDKPPHCDFLPRCPYATEQCKESPYPETEPVAPEHYAACYRAKEPLKDTIFASDFTEEHRATKRIGTEPILQVRNLEMAYYSGAFRRKEAVRILDGLSFNLYPGETFGLVGESGCGKTTVARCIMRFVKPTGGQILYKGFDLAKAPYRDIRPLRKNIQIVFQDPFSSLDPRQSVGSVVAEPLRVHRLAKPGKELDDRVDELLTMVGLSPEMRNRMPHEFSGGQRQRLGIARALAVNPDVILCDEPISALDVSIQAQIVNLLAELQQRTQISYVFIAHDLSVVRHISDRVAVMYLGRIVEIASWSEIYDCPLHPYTQALLSAIPIPDPTVEASRPRIAIHGEVPSVVSRPSGCAFHNRCAYAKAECKSFRSELIDFGNGHMCACPYAKEIQHV